jgi:nucleoid DNA-binding protein
MLPLNIRYTRRILSRKERKAQKKRGNSDFPLFFSCILHGGNTKFATILSCYQSPVYKSRRTPMVAKKKAAAKKAPAKKAVVAKKAVAAKKAPAAKAAVAKPAAPKKLTAVKEAMTKTAMMLALAEQSGVSKKDVTAVVDALGGIIEAHIKKGAVGFCNIPGLMKVKTIRKPAQKARKNVPNPFKPGEMMDVAAKPARTVVKVLPLKKLKDMAG